MSQSMIVIHHRDTSWTVICRCCSRHIGERVPPRLAAELLFLKNHHACTPVVDARHN